MRAEEELLKRQSLEKKRLPKQQKADAKTRSIMFRQSLRLGPNQCAPDQERDRIRQVRPDQGHPCHVVYRPLKQRTFYQFST